MSNLVPDLVGHILMFQSNRQGRNNEIHFIKATQLSAGGQRARHYEKYVYSGDPARASSSEQKYMWICHQLTSSRCALESYYYPGRFMSRTIHDEHSRKRVHVESATLRTGTDGMHKKFHFKIYGAQHDAMIMSMRKHGTGRNSFGGIIYYGCERSLLQTNRNGGNKKILAKQIRSLDFADGVRLNDGSSNSKIYRHSGQSCRFNIHKLAAAPPARL